MLNYIIRRLTHKFTTAYGFSEPFFCSPKPAVENLWIMRGDLMKIFCKYYVFALLFLIFSACEMPDNKGKIVVTNQAENETDVIIAVYAKPENENSYSLYWSNTEGAGYMQDAYFYIESGNYDLKVWVRKQTSLFPYYIEDYFKTGYKNPVKVEEDKYSFVYYDGKGIYQK